MECLVSHGTCSLLETFFPESELEVSTNSNTSMLYSDSIRLKLKNDIIELQKNSSNRLKGWRKDKSFHDVWIYIDEFAELTNFTKAKTNFSQFSPDSDSIDDEDSNQQLITEQHWNQLTRFQSTRIESIQNWLLIFNSDKNFVKGFLEIF